MKRLLYPLFLVVAVLAVAIAFLSARQAGRQAAAEALLEREKAAQAVAVERVWNVAAPAPAEAPPPEPKPVPAAEAPQPATTPSPAAAVPAAAPPPAPKAAPVRRGKPAPKDPMAREALSLVGADVGAEAIWLQAINNPDLPANERKDLIEDLNEDGFPDPKNITEDDLPLILSRMAVIEAYAGEAMDEVNLAAFAEAYKDLVNMCARLLQEPLPGTR